MTESLPHRISESISTCRGAGFREWRDKMRRAFSLHAMDMLSVLDGAACPLRATTYEDGVAK